ncbi:MAG: symmetrical bis(5'-nucleosyl)-tetraphosphatase [Pseudomonadota bacterium]
MSTYAIGDIQGCHEELQALLEKIQFDRNKDRLWLTGDLVNRGNYSLEVLRFVKSLGDSAQTVLGNHDIHLLGLAYGYGQHLPEHDLIPILEAPDREVLLDWLRCQPLLLEHKALGYMMIHAGFPPQWDTDTARRCAEEVESVLRGDNCTALLRQLYDDQPDCWDEALKSYERYRFIINCLTRIRVCDKNGHLNLHYKDTLDKRPPDSFAWFNHPQRQSKGQKIIFGHWAALEGMVDEPNIFAIDTGCCWGRELTAMRLEDQQRFSVPSQTNVFSRAASI